MLRTDGSTDRREGSERPPHVEFQDEALPHVDALFGYAYSLTREPMAAEDLVQETMFKAWRNWHRYRHGSNAKAWLLKILHNTFLSDYRRRRRSQRTLDAVRTEQIAFQDVADVDPEGHFFEQLIDEEVIDAVNRLPDDFRQVVVLSDLADLNYAEIAEVTEVPLGTVKSRLFRARRVLQQALVEYAVENGYISHPLAAAGAGA